MRACRGPFVGRLRRLRATVKDRRIAASKQAHSCACCGRCGAGRRQRASRSRGASPVDEREEIFYAEGICCIFGGCVSDVHGKVPRKSQASGGDRGLRQALGGAVCRAWLELPVASPVTAGND
ncbi:MAG: hypothetical protein AW07_03992 [Candidatus Accumulibacter sp. SK-11]|nr:MAG: hypothetical protein AW07_03992 [Candidatus Accumulibacter sp. SK-11]